jgi:formylglycine-generating enzyme required for sulfatase activity
MIDVESAQYVVRPRRACYFCLVFLVLSGCAAHVDVNTTTEDAEAQINHNPAGIKPVPDNSAIDFPNAGARDESGMKPYTEVIPGTDVQFDMVPIPGGKFLMGASEEEFRRFNKKDPNDKFTKEKVYDEGPQHEVAIDPFWMGKYEVTWAEFELWSMKLEQMRRILKQDQENLPPTARDQLVDAVALPTSPYGDMTFGMGKAGCPAVCMTQLSAKIYCKWLSAITGRYYRLPTEAEWEYACRAGNTTAYYFGDDPAQLDEYAWSFDNADDKYHKVGQKKPNPWGLYDMLGNVSEWVLDQYAVDSYRHFAGKSSDNPLVPAATEYSRVVRGGSWTEDPPDLRSTARRPSVKEWKSQDPQNPQSIWYLTDAKFVGFRVVCPLRTPSAEEARKYELDDEQQAEIENYRKAGKQ